MNIRIAAVAAVVVSLVAGLPAADAAKKKKAPPPVCNLVVDDKADELVPDGSLDILSADIASDSRKLTGVIRLNGAPDAVNPASPTGRVYNLQFSGQSASAPVFLSFIAAPNAQAATYGYFDEATRINNGLGEATLKIKGNDIYMTVAHGVYSAYGKFKPGNKITGIQVVTGRMLGAYANSGAYAYNTVTADSALDGKTYTAGARSCVKVGG